MSHGVFDQRGVLLLSTESEMLAFVTAMRRQSQGLLTTVLLGGSAEVLFAPYLPNTKRAITALELEAQNLGSPQLKTLG